jgi:hypothetical protein
MAPVRSLGHDLQPAADLLFVVIGKCIKKIQALGDKQADYFIISFGVAHVKDEWLQCTDRWSDIGERHDFNGQIDSYPRFLDFAMWSRKALLNIHARPLSCAQGE